MTIPVEYRPGIASTVAARVDLDGWAAGGIGAAGIVDNQATEWFLTKLDGWHAAPPVRTSITDRPGEHGAFDGPAYLSPRVLTLEGIAVCADLASTLRARDIVASVCGDTGALTTLVVHESGRPTRQMLVRRSAETKTRPVYGNQFGWSLIVVAPDPRRYSDTLSSQAIGLPQVGSGGLVFPLVFPLTFGSGVGGGQMTLTNSGTIATWPTWQVLGPVTGPVITCLDTGERLEFDPTFSVPAGQTLTIDTAAKTVVLTGVSRRDRLFVSQWFRLRPGPNAIRFSSAAGSDPAASLTGQWRDAWT